MTSTLSDAELVSAYLTGDRGALAAIYDRYSSGLYDTAAAMLSDRHDAADMVQDVFCLAAARLDQLRDPSRLKPWLYAVLRNEVYRRTKRRRRATLTDFQSDTVPDVVAPIDPAAEGASVAFSELATLVREAAAGLDERDQLILELSVRQGLEGADLADALGVTPEQSYSLVHRMRERVERSLGAFIVAKAGRKECPSLDEILRDWDGRFSVIIRKRVARHIDSCETCEETKGKVAPLALFGAAPVLAAPLGLRDKVLSATGNIAIPGTGTNPANLPRLRLRARDGFPRATRLTRRFLWMSTSVAVLVAAGSLVMVAGSSNSDTTPASAVNIVPADSVVQSTSSVASPVTSPVTSSVGPTSSSEPSTVDPSTTKPSTVEPSTPATSLPTNTSVVTPVGTPTTPAATTTTTPAVTTTKPATTTTGPSPLTAIVLSSSTLDFGISSTSVSLRLTNKNSTARSWKIASNRPAFFTFSPATGTLAAGATTTVTVTFARSATQSYANTSTFPEGRFSVAAQATATGVPAAAFQMVGAIGRAPQVGTIATRFTSTSCANVSLQVPVTDESAIKSVVATVSMISTTSSTTTRTINLTDSGKGSWVGTTTDLPGSTSSVSISVRATDVIGLATTVGAKVSRPTSC